MYPSESYLPTISSEITHRVVGEQSSHNQQILSSELEIALTLHPSLTVFQLDTTLDGFEPLARVLRIAECKYATFLPVRTGTTLSGIIAIGAWEKQALKPEVQELINLLISFAGTVLGRIDTLIRMQKQLAVLQTIYTAGKVIGEETKLDNLYRLIHEEVESVIGKIDFMIALYEPENNRIDIPYVKEGDQYLTLPAIPYGQGLISIPIRTHQPLMLVEDTRQQALELGVEVTGTAPKSWLGVPLLVSGEAIGVMIAQDFEHEHRFDDEDQRLLNTLAVQIAITIRNARLLSETQHRAHLDRQLHEITNRIRTSTDIPTILKTTVNELAQTFGARRVRIEIGEGGAGSPDTESGEGSDLEDRL